MATAGHATTDEIVQTFEQYVVPNYRRFPVALARGEGSHVWDAEGRKYLDFFPGWGCNLLGHCPEPVVEAVRAQYVVHRSTGPVGEDAFGAKLRRPGVLL